MAIWARRYPTTSIHARGAGGPLYMPSGTLLSIWDEPTDVDMSSRLAREGGTTPILYITGNMAARDIRVKVTTGGVIGTCQLAVSTDHGSNYGTPFTFNGDPTDIGGGTSVYCVNGTAPFVLNAVYRSVIETWANRVAGVPGLYGEAGAIGMSIAPGPSSAIGSAAASSPLGVTTTGLYVGSQFRIDNFISTANQPFSVVAILKQGTASAVNTIFRIGGTATNYPIHFYFSAARRLKVGKRCGSDGAEVAADSGATFTPANTTWQLVGVTCDGTTAKFWAGVSLSVTSPAAFSSAGGSYSASVAGTDGMGGLVQNECEGYAGLWVANVEYTTGDMQAIRDAAVLRWGAGLS
jgi:hypothetical protein